MVDISRTLGMAMRVASVLKDDAMRAKLLDELQARGLVAFRRIVHERRGDMDRVLYVEICRVMDEQPLPEGSSDGKR